MRTYSYRELVVWQKSMDVAKDIYYIVKKLPKEELFGLSDQMRRCAVSIPSNIAEGQERITTPEFLKFLSYAQGSRAELETQLLLCMDIGYVAEREIMPILQKLTEIGKMINSLTKAINSNQPTTDCCGPRGMPASTAEFNLMWRVSLMSELTTDNYVYII